MQKIKLGDICTLKTGPFGTQFKAGEYTTTGIPVINVKNIGNGIIIEKDLDFVSQDTANRLSEHIVHYGDIIFARKGAIERHIFIDKECDGWMQGSDCIKATIFPEYNSKFISYYLSLPSIRKQLLSNAVGSTMPSMNTNILKNIQIEIPPLEEQKKIGSILGALDDKILLNKKINATLEEMARTLYDYYFVQFDFPDENGKPYKSSGGKMIFNAELNREIPAGWQVCKLSEFGNLKNGINYDKNTSGDKLVKIVNVKDISASKFSITTESLDDIILPSAQIEKYLTTTEDILIARSGIPGAARAITGENKFVIYCGFIICLKLYNQIFKNYLLFTLQKNYEIISVKSTGTIMPNVTQDTLKKIPLIEPPQEILQKFNATVEPMLDELNRKLLENQTLANLRDYLLPLLMNGQVTIKR